jgi:hypothetical protein
MRFTLDELRRAVVALDIINQHGDRDEWALLQRQARDSAPNGNRWNNATPNQRINGGLLADQLADLLGEPRDYCEQAAAEVFAPQHHRAMYDVLVAYADELIGRSPRREPPPSRRLVQRPTVRIVGDQEGVA